MREPIGILCIFMGKSVFGRVFATMLTQIQHIFERRKG